LALPAPFSTSMRTAPLLFASASIAFFAIATSAAGGVPDGARFVRGTARVRRAGARDWAPASIGQIYQSGITVEAQGDSPIELDLPDGVVVTMEPGATGEWRAPGRLPAEGNNWARGYHLALVDGEIDVKVPAEPRGGHAFLVETTAGTLTDWRGSVHLLVKGDTTAAAIYEGALVIGSNGQGFAVFDPTGVVMKKGVDPERARGIPPPPSWAAEPPPGAVPPFAIVPAGERATLGFAWNAAPGAASYRYEVATDPAFAHVVQRGNVTEPTIAMQEPQGGGGSYFARVRTVAEGGIVGGWSEQPAHARVVRVSYPDGSTVARDGAIILREGTHVTLSDADGLEAALQTYDGPAPPRGVPLVWMKAPPELALGDTGSRIVHLRDPSFNKEFLIVLGRRELHAAIDMCPTTARWPENPVYMRVRVQDPSGRLDVSSEALRIETTVNLEPVALEWRQGAAAWYARLAPQMDTPGPWLVHVSVKDATGAEIGRGFLGVDPVQAPKLPGTPALQ
jgi:hypothetical protein